MEDQKTAALLTGNWQEFPLIDTAKIPDFAGVYALYLVDELVYFGTSQNIRLRSVSHCYRMTWLSYCEYHKNGGWLPNPFGYTIKTRECPCACARRILEAKLIRSISPRLNASQPNIKKIIEKYG